MPRTPGPFLRPEVPVTVGGAGAAAAVALAVSLASPWPLAVLPAASLVLRYLPPLPGAAAAALLAVLAGSLGAVLGGLAAGAALLAATALGGAASALWRQDAHRVAALLGHAEQRLAARTVQDELTGCANRRGLLLLGEPVLQGVRRSGDSVHASLVEVSGLDDVRIASGPVAADLVLMAVAEALTAGTRAADVVARLSPDTFVVVGAGAGSTPAELERRIRVHLLDDPPVSPALWPCRVTAGTGVLEPWDGGGLTDLLGRAEQDLSLRRAMRAPSAPEPPARERRRS